jgi:hypothetical protein
MNRWVNARLRAESVLCVASAVLALLTLVWRDWLEEVFGFDPDRHSGSVEWAIVSGLAVLAVGLGIGWLRDRRLIAASVGSSARA